MSGSHMLHVNLALMIVWVCRRPKKTLVDQGRGRGDSHSFDRDADDRASHFAHLSTTLALIKGQENAKKMKVKGQRKRSKLVVSQV